MTDRPTRDDQANVAARAIIDAERAKQAAKTARLQEARLAKEAADLLGHAPGKPRARALKAKAKR
jgi:hypothetical protein